MSQPYPPPITSLLRVSTTGRRMDYIEMNRLSKDPAGVRATAELILQVVGGELTENSHAFLSKLVQYDGEKPLTTRQLEHLYALREKSTRRTKAGRYTASVLIRKAFELRYDLSAYEDEDWLEQMHSRGHGVAISNSEWRRLIRLCKELDLIYKDEWIPL